MPRLTQSVKRGLEGLAEYGRSWLEADDWQTPQGSDEDDNGTRVADMEAAIDWLNAGGFPLPKRRM